jgi:MYXO-CTERM domain-containing protein
MLGWGLASAALAGIDVNGTVHATLADAVAAARTGDTLVFDGGTYEGGVQLDAIELTFEGNGSTLQVASGTEIVRLTGGASLTASDLTFAAAAARGIDGDSGAVLTLTDVTFRTALAVGNGGGVRLFGPAAVALTRVVFDHTSVGGSGANGLGGGLSVSVATGPVVLSDVTFDGTTAANRGGAIYALASAVDCVGCVFAGTSAVGEGGAIYGDGAPLTLEDSTFLATAAEFGGGGAIRTDGPLTVVGSTFCNTSAGGNGGAIFSTGAGGVVTASVFLDAATTAAGLGSVARLQSDAWTLAHNHFLSASGSTEAVSLQNATVDAVDNLFAFHDGTALALTGGGWAAGSPRYQAFFANGGDLVGAALDADDVLADPRLAGFADDGICGNDDLWPRFGSPLIDAGDPSLLDPDGGRSDIGAFGGPAAPLALFEDGDGDGADFLHDCDDADVRLRPGLLDDCDGLDEDCSGLADDDPSTFPTWFEDCDGDGQGDLGTAATQCEPPSAACDWLAWDPAVPEVAGDCDDADPAVFLGADERCTEADEDCDGIGGLDELGVVDGAPFFLDGDLDGYGDPLREVQACRAATGRAATGDDCDDDRADVNPGATDACGDDVDQDCSGVDGPPAEERAFWVDDDGDGYGDELALPVRTCATALAGAVENDDDCDDALDTVHPGATETCDGADQDCDDLVDDVGQPEVTYYGDADGDGFGDERLPQVSQCGRPPGFADRAGDCDDEDGDVNPDADEVCNGVDDDCDQAVDADDDDLAGGAEGWIDRDGDGYGACGADPACAPARRCALGPQPDGSEWVGNPDDCDDAATDVNPGTAEIPGNTVDENCDGRAASPPTAALPPDHGCNCDAAGGSPWPGLAGLALLALRRRRS